MAENPRNHQMWLVWFAGVGILVLGLADILMIVSLYAVDLSTGTEHYSTCGITLSPRQVETTLIFLSGALGAFIHAATSFGYHMGRGTMKEKSLWWYAFRMPIGAGLAFIVVGFLKSSLVTESGSASYNMNGLMAMAGMAGLFSKQAIDKLAEIFTGILRPTSKDKESPKS